MRTIKALVFAVAAVAGSTAVPADAQYSRRPAYDDNWQREAHDYGYQAGLNAGRDDARRGWKADHGRHDAYRRANLGFRIGGLSINLYQTSFRRGFGDGYSRGFAEFTVNVGNNGYGQRYYPPNDYRDNRYGRRQDYAFQRGFEDGYRRGRDDGRDGDRYDVYRHRDYRNGDDGYNRRFGPRDFYRDSYREGFRAGYDRGYREFGRGYGRTYRRW